MANQAKHVPLVSMFLLFPIQNFVSQPSRCFHRNATWEMYFSNSIVSRRRQGRMALRPTLPTIHRAEVFAGSLKRFLPRTEKTVRNKVRTPVAWCVCNGGRERKKRRKLHQRCPNDKLEFALTNADRRSGPSCRRRVTSAVTEEWEL